MGKSYGHRSRGGPPQPPDPLQEVRKIALQMYDPHNGEGADWSSMARTLFRLAFDALDHLDQADAQRHAMLRHTETAVYDRLHGAEADARHTHPD